MQKEKPILRTLQGEKRNLPPCWFMRQSGRYLPEYRKLRATSGSFLDLCFTPTLVHEATMLPLKRYKLDAAIIFSDILVVPYAMGQKIEFCEGKGPILAPIGSDNDVKQLNIKCADELAPVYEAIERVYSDLDKATTLIGFAGGAWTLAAYMLEGKTSRDFMKAKKFAFMHSQAFSELLDKLIDSISSHLINQVRAGAEVLQIFDSWAGVVPYSHLQDWILKPTKAIVKKVKAIYPHVPIIGFPRGLGASYRDFTKVGVDAISVDQFVSLTWACENIPSSIVLQGAMDPYELVCGGELLRQQAIRQMEKLKNRPYIFNLGHGIVPETPPENVEELLQTIRDYSSKIKGDKTLVSTR